MGLKNWATQKLQPGDLTALKSLADGRALKDRARIERLRKRGFIADGRNGVLRITTQGRLALTIKNLAFH